LGQGETKHLDKLQFYIVCPKVDGKVNNEVAACHSVDWHLDNRHFANVYFVYIH